MSEYSKIESLFGEVTIMDGPLENFFWGGGGAGQVQKKYSRKGKLNVKKFMHAY